MIVTESSLNCDGNVRRCLISHGSQESVRRGCSSRRSGNVTEDLTSRRSVTGVPSAWRVSTPQIPYLRDGIYQPTQNPRGACPAQTVPSHSRSRVPAKESPNLRRICTGSGVTHCTSFGPVLQVREGTAPISRARPQSVWSTDEYTTPVPFRQRSCIILIHRARACAGIGKWHKDR
jgi:hypothetical protein